MPAGSPGYEGQARRSLGNGGEDQMLSPGLRRTAVQARFDGTRPIGLPGNHDDGGTVADGRSEASRLVRVR